MSSRYKTSEPLLDSEYKTKVETAATIAASDSVGLMSDGWSSIRNEPITNFVVSQPEPIFWKSFHTDLQSHTREYIATEVLKVIEELESECVKMDFGVVTDNPSNMKKAWRLIKEKYPTIISHGCAAHGLNLMFCGVIKLETCKNITKRAKGVITKLIHKHMLADMLKAMQKAENVNCTLKLPVKTIWASMVISLKSVKKKQSSAAQNCCFRIARKRKQQLVKSPPHSSGRHTLA